MKNGNQSAFPQNGLAHGEKGLTKREHFAGMAMQGLLSNPNYNYVEVPRFLAEEAFKCADAVIEESEKVTSR